MVIVWGMLAFIAGGMITLSGILNAQLGKKIGVYRAALINNGLAAITALFIVLVIYKGISISLSYLVEIPPWVLSGGLITVIVVVGANILIPKIPVIYTTLFVFTGQFITALIIDWVNRVPVTTGKIIGFLLIFMGLCYNIYFDMQNKSTK